MIADCLRPVLMHPNRGIEALISSRFVRNINKQLVEQIDAVFKDPLKRLLSVFRIQCRQSCTVRIFVKRAGRKA